LLKLLLKDNIAKNTPDMLNSISDTQALHTILGLPMALGELGFAFWLIIKGARIKEIE
jgi:hypothetical protein